MTAEQLWHPPPPQDLPSIQPSLYGNLYAFSVLNIVSFCVLGNFYLIIFDYCQ
jgi:hypothetical protein